ncbi:hypothetical protein P0Y67_06580 [Photobacterium sp. SP02]|uniref:hypothetical protein n=1 Tax=Photobacterium sp. SP02 TaxID=3032280 RepID=UPI0031453714
MLRRLTLFTLPLLLLSLKSNAEVTIDKEINTSTDTKIGISAISAAKPQISINFPSGVYHGDSRDFKITTKYANQCKLWITQYATSPITFTGNYTIKGATFFIRQNQNPTSYQAKVTCNGSAGATTITHNFSVLKRTSGNNNPTITSFMNSNVINGATKLYWGTRNVDRCTLESKGKTESVLKSNAIGYPVTIPSNGATFNLACSKGTMTARKSLYVPRPNARFSSKENAQIVRSSNLQSDFLNYHYSSLLDFGIDLHSDNFSTQNVDINGDKNEDFLVINENENKLYIFTINYDQVLSKPFIEENVTSFIDIRSILLENDKAMKVFLNE